MPTSSDSTFLGSQSTSATSLSLVPYPSSSHIDAWVPASSETADPAPVETGAAIEDDLGRIERREHQLWITLGTLSMVVTIGMVLIVLPQLIEISSSHPDKAYLPRLFLALVGLMALLNIYLTVQRGTLRKTREALLREREHRQAAETAAIMDPLTQSFNRRYMDQLIEKELSRAGRLGTQIAFLMIDVDDFKSVNTRFGHIVGDAVLREVADVVRKSVRASDTVVRYGGDEFLVILTEAEESDAERVIARMDQRVNAWNKASKIEGYHMGLSCGWATHEKGTLVTKSLEAADKKMYDCKHRRKIGWLGDLGLADLN
jgi:diguanylate cyclase (GGDEF)-like protein